MKKSEFKKLVKECVRECIYEVIVESNAISNIVSEVVKGVSNASIISERQEKNNFKEKKQYQEKKENNIDIESKKKLREAKEKMMNIIGKDAYGGVDIFEGVEPAISEMSPEQMAKNPLRGTDPNDPGVDISGIMKLGGKHWKGMMGK